MAIKVRLLWHDLVFQVVYFKCLRDASQSFVLVWLLTPTYNHFNVAIVFHPWYWYSNPRRLINSQWYKGQMTIVVHAYKYFRPGFKI